MVVFRTVAATDLEIGADLFDAGAGRAAGNGAKLLAKTAALLRDDKLETAARLEAATSDVAAEAMRAAPDRANATVHDTTYEIEVDREQARFSAWYELFPRSWGEPGRHGTFLDVADKLDYVADMGFDVVYLTPIHPIGTTNRKGRNNTLHAKPGDPGSPYGIGSAEGGHDAIHPELGTFEDFDDFVARARELGMEVALDIALQASPDHPWVTEHPEWFTTRADGTIAYAENPPKKYQDIYPLNFDNDPEGIYHAVRDMLQVWIDHGVTLFRVDNPHTKPLDFWERILADVRAAHPEVIFLSEAFTRPAMMRTLAAIGFHQSYTYFTWRTTKEEVGEYLEEVNNDTAHVLRPNFWPNTPDILTEYLQTGGRGAFLTRLLLAATLSSNYGIYGPAFELLESEPRHHGSEEYMDSEKYEIKAWDLDRPGNIRNFITRLNRIRRENRALQEYDNLRFHLSDNDQILFYEKSTPDGDNILFIAVNLDPFNAHEGTLFFPMNTMGLGETESWEADELLTGYRWYFTGSHQQVRLDPGAPAVIFRAPKSKI